MNITTTDLADFGWIERQELIKILQAWQDKGLPQDFELGEIIPMMNFDSGNVFLTNYDYQVAMMNGNDLKRFYVCRECGHEGFLEDCQLNDNGCNECEVHNG